MLDRWRLAPLWAHAGALLLVLLGLLAAVGPDWSYSADEGAAIIEARSLSRGDGWLVAHPLPEADADLRHYPLELSEWGEKGIAPYAKHPLYPLLLSGADRVAGTRGMLVLSVLGTVGAAWAGALLSGRVRSGTEVAAFWVLGLLSPLLFNGLWVIAHSLAAGLVGLALLAAVRAGEGPRWPLWSSLSAVSLGVALGLRTEVAFVVIALVLVAGWRAWRERSVPWLSTAVATVAAAAVVRVAEGAALSAIVGASRPRPQFGRQEASSFVADRWAGFAQTWLSPDAVDDPMASFLLLAAALCAVVAVWQLVRRDGDLRLMRAASILFAALAVARVAVVPATAVPGLLVAFPLLWIGLAVGRGSGLRSDPGRTVAAVAAIGAVGILGTQYRTGGSAEWGGRYFAILLPLAVPLAVAGLAAARDRVGPAVARQAGTALLVGSFALSTLAVLSLRASHQEVERGVTSVTDAAATLPGRPVIVTALPALPRFAWSSFHDHRWLLVDLTDDPSDLRALGDGLAQAGIDRFVLVAPGVESLIGELGLRRVPGSPGTGGLAVVERA